MKPYIQELIKAFEEEFYFPKVGEFPLGKSEVMLFDVSVKDIEDFLASKAEELYQKGYKEGFEEGLINLP